MKKQCPDEEILADYMEGHLSSQDRLRLETHLAACDMCLENFMIGKQMALESNPLEPETAPIHVTKSAARLVSDLNVRRYDVFRKRAGRFVKGVCTKVSDYLAPPVCDKDLVLVRGDESMPDDRVHISKKFNGIHTDIEIEKTGEDTAHIRIRLTEHHANVRATLKKENREISSVLLNEDDTLFEDILFGHYRLVLAKDGLEIGTYSFEVRETRHGSE